MRLVLVDVLVASLAGLVVGLILSALYALGYWPRGSGYSLVLAFLVIAGAYYPVHLTLRRLDKRKHPAYYAALYFLVALGAWLSFYPALLRG